MGRIGIVTAFRRTEDGDAKIAEVDVDLGGNDIITADVYGDSGSDAPPVSGDYAAVMAGPGTGEWVAVAFTDTRRAGTGAQGERVTVARDADGVVVSTVTQAADGSARVENDNGYMELKADGQADINGHFTVEKAAVTP